MSHAPDTVIDAYAGTGDGDGPRSARGVAVMAIEADPTRGGVCARFTAGSRAVAARVEDVLPRALPADVVILNPPRVGLAAPVTAALATRRRAPRAMMYVSCDPATLARDVARVSRAGGSHHPCLRHVSADRACRDPVRARAERRGTR